MSSPPSLAHLQLLRRLRQQLRHRGSGLGLIYLFSDYSLANQWLMGELNTYLRTRTQCLHLVQPQSVSDAFELILESTTSMPYWLELGNPQTLWDAYRDKVLARFNENRSLLTRNNRFIFIILPTDYENRAADIAPDLWSVRSASYHVAAWAMTRNATERITPPPPQLHTAAAASFVDESVIQRWNAQWNQWNQDRSRNLSPQLAWQLVDQLLEAQQLDPAQEIAAQALEITRHRQTLGDSPQVLRDLSISLDNMGDAETAAGRNDSALVAYRESLELRRQLRESLGDSPQVLRDLFVSLSFVGNAETAAGRNDAALVAYRESLDLARQLRELLGDSPQVLRDLAASLSFVGNAETAAGRNDAALVAYRESLELARQLRESLGDSPQVLRDLAASLSKVGDAESEAGRNDAALVAYRESLELARQLRESLGDSPQVLRDLSVSLEKVGDGETAVGRNDAALVAYRESLEIRRQLRESLGDSPQVLRDLAASLSKVGDAESEAGRNDAALVAYHESLELARQLRESVGDSPLVLDDLAVSLEKLAASGGVDMPLRKAYINEALALRQQLVAVFPDSEFYRKRLKTVKQLLAGL